MRRFCVYTLLQLKRALGYLPFVLGVSLLLCLCLTLALTAIIRTDNSGEDKQKMSVAIVGDPGDTYLNFGLSALRSFDSSRFSLEIVELNEQQAQTALRSREIAGYAVIPADFIEDAFYGDVGKITFVTGSDSADMVTVFKQELLSLVSCLLVESQNGVYGMRDALAESGIARGEINKQTDVLMLEYVDLILSRSNAIEVEVIGLSDSLTLGGYMFTGISVLMILLSGIITCPLYIRRDMAFCKVLGANRCGGAAQTAGEYLSFFVIILVNSSVLLTILMVGAGRAVPELAALDAGRIAAVLLAFIPGILLITAMQYFMYQLADSLVSGALMQFVAAVFLGYLSGCFYPISFFPSFVQKLSLLIPSGLARSYLASVVNSSATATEVLAPVIYALLLTVCACLVRRCRMQTR